MADDEIEKPTAKPSVDVEGASKGRATGELSLADALVRRTSELQEQREWFEVTLASIGDAVITTNTLGQVTFLNPVAETMTGWASSDARGQDLETVFRIVNEETGVVVPNPIREVLQTGKVVGLANHTALIHKGTGAQTAIEDSAAPIRDAANRVIGAVMVFHDVTARRKAERALRTSEEQLRTIFEQVPVGIAVVNLDTSLNHVNQRFADILGYTPEEMKSMNFTHFTHPDDMQLSRSHVAQLDSGRGTGYSSEKRYIRKDGQVVWSRTVVEMLRDGDGKAYGYLGIIDDITERRAAAEAVRSSAQRLALALTAANLHDWSWDAKTDILTMGPSLRELLGLAPDVPVRAEDLRQFLIIEDAENQRAAAKKALAQRTAFNVQYQVKRPGVTRSPWLDARGQGVYGPDGSIIGMVGVLQDVTEQKETELALSRLAALVESSEDAIISKNLSSTIQTWNRAAEAMFGYTAEEAIGQSVTMLIPEGQADEEPQILERLRRGERIQHYETVRRRKDGKLIQVSLSVSPVRDSAGRIIGASKIARDITRQKATESDNARLYEAAQREIASRERAEAALRETDKRKDEFLATLAHELRNPLAPIRQAALISKAPAATEAQKRWSHDVISRQVHHMALLLDDLLDISRITRGTLELRREQTEIAAVVDAAVETARPAIDAKRHTLTLNVPKSPVHFEADPLRLAQVLSNLLTNAAKYTDPGGEITLGVEVSDDALSIVVKDTGIGIDAPSLNHVFAMFSQVKSGPDRSEGGLGIGLALARGLTELHEGTIEARSEGHGRGSEFIVRLPLRRRKAVRPRESEAAAPRKGVKRRILIADDNRDAAESLAMLLQMEGHEVTVVHDGKEALAAFASTQPEVALLDIGMPEMNGYDVARHVRQGSLGRAVTLIAVTGWGQDNDKAQALAAGFNHHFTKPIEPERLTALLRSESL